MGLTRECHCQLHLGLARSRKAEEKLKHAGAGAVRGFLNDIEVLKHGAACAGVVIHMGFFIGFSRYEEAVAADLAAVKAIGCALEGTDKPFVNTAGTLGVTGLDRTATDDDRGPELTGTCLNLLPFACYH